MELNYFDTEIGRCTIVVRDWKIEHGFDGFAITNPRYIVYDEDGQVVAKEVLHEMNIDDMDEFVLRAICEAEQENADGCEPEAGWSPYEDG